MQQSKPQTLPAIPEKKGKINLSPFTWNNLRLPPIMKAYNSIQIKHNIQKGKQRLTTISEAKHRIKNESVSLQKKLSKQQKSVSREKHVNKTIVVRSSQQMQKPNKNETNRKQNKRQMTKTLDLIENIPKNQKIKILDQTGHTERYVKTQSLRNGWRYNKQIQNQNTLAHNYERFSENYQDFINGSKNLTKKDYLSEEMKRKGKQFYPLSFLIPKDSQAFIIQNNKIAVKSMLRRISQEIIQYLQSQNMKDNSWKETKVHIGDILRSIILKTSSQHASILIKMCMYLQNLRLQENFCYFQSFSTYSKMNIKPKNNFYNNLIEQASYYLDQKLDLFLQINYRSIDFRLLVLILHYDALFKQYESTYNTPDQLWIIKSFESSKENYITILKSSSHLCSNEDTNYVQLKIKKKYQNKIIQKYLPNPYLLNSTPVFSQRKFIIKQPVLVIQIRNSFSLYKYQSAYCRFASEKYDYFKLEREIHLTNFEQLRENNVMLIQQLFQACKQDLRAKYSQQSVKIIKRVINKVKSQQFIKQSYQLFIFDFILDSNGKLFLLDINQNKSKIASKHQKLNQENQLMNKTMKQLVSKQNINTEKWAKLLGSQMSHQDSEIIPLSLIQIKPFYKCSLEQGQSLIQLIRIRRRVLSKMVNLVKKIHGKNLFKLLNALKQKDSNDIAQINVQSNEIQNVGEIRFIQQRQISNA